MEVRKSYVAEIYDISGNPRDALIPSDADMIIVEYDAKGETKSILYCKRNGLFQIKNDGVKEELDKCLNEIGKMNSRKLSPEEMNHVAGLLKKLSS